MIDIDCLYESEPPSTGGGSAIGAPPTWPALNIPFEEWPEECQTGPRDIDGYPIPKGRVPEKWNKLPRAARQSWSNFGLIDAIRDRRLEETKANKKARSPAPPFTTQYAVNWGRKQKKASGLSWALIDRERFVKSPRDGVRSRHHDLMIGLDVLFDDGRPGMVGIQAAGRNEKADHWKKFCARGGVEVAQSRGIRVFYMEFERGNPEPILTEQWA